MAVDRAPAIFLDKDGTLVKDIPYNADPDKIFLEQGVAEGLRLLKAAGFRLVVVSNQSGIARGYFYEKDFGNVIQKLGELLLVEAGVALSGFYYCPHHPDGSVAGYAVDCSCRKPRPGLLIAAAQEQEIALEDSWMIGDILNDVEAGRRAGCHTVLILNGNETEWTQGPLRTPDFTAGNMEEAARTILLHSRPLRPAPEARQPGGLRTDIARRQ
jgi:D,D-heptose 1,7-bisphosphate phosphatase